MPKLTHLWLSVSICGLVSAAYAGPKSGPQVGERPMPFTANMVTGPFRGQQHCYVCDLKDETAVLVFARSMSPPTGRFLKRLQEAVNLPREKKLFAWCVFLGKDGPVSEETALETAAYQFARASGAAGLPVGALRDSQGPPSYLVAGEAEVTVVLFRSKKVLANHSFSQKEWGGGAVDRVLKDVDKVLAAP